MNNVRLSWVFVACPHDDRLSSFLALLLIGPRNTMNLPFNAGIVTCKPRYGVHVRADLCVNEVDVFAHYIIKPLRS